MDHDDIVRASRWTVIRALLALALTLIAQVMAAVVVIFCGVPLESLLANTITVGCGGAAAVLGVIALGGGDWVSISRDDVRYTFRMGWWYLAVAGALMGLGIISYLVDRKPLAPDALTNLLELGVFCLAVGISEEAMFRGIVFNAILAVKGGTHRGVVWSVIATSVLFGAAHIDYSIAFNDAITFVQAILKIVQTGMYSFLLCVVVLRTRRLGGVSLFHALDDFLILVPSSALFESSFDTSYINTGSDAMATIMLYLIVIALYAPAVVISARELRSNGPDSYRGVFMEDVVEAVEKAQAAHASQPSSHLSEAVEPAPTSPSVPVRQGVVPQEPAADVTRWALDDMAGGASSARDEGVQDGPASVPGCPVTAPARRDSGRPPVPGKFDRLP